ncbi:Retrovirus-related Pol polyprotein from transposon RE2, partial [Linum perenne]
ALKRVLRYIKRALRQGLHFPKVNGLVLKANCDVDWAGCALTCRLTTSYFIKLDQAPISWLTKKQNVVFRSSAEVECRHGPSGCVPFITLRLNPIFHEHIKHVEMDCHLICE